MKLDFSNMTIGSQQFNWARTSMVTLTGGAVTSDCLKAAALIKDNDDESWAAEWASLAVQAVHTAEQAMQAEQREEARKAYLRASNYYRAAMFPLPMTNPNLFEYLTHSRENFHKAADLFTTPIEVVGIPFEGASLPGYFLPAGKANMPTLLAINGGDSTNEELVHWVGLTAQSRGWNCFVLEGPGQWSALQLNPGLYLRADYEVPVKAVLDWLIKREEVDPDKIAIIGYSLSTQLSARVAALEKRVRACVCFGGIIPDVNEAWEGVLPAKFRKAAPLVFDTMFAALEKTNSEARGFANHAKWEFGVTKPHEILEAWRPFNIKGLASKIECPVLVLMGEGEYEQTDDRMTLSGLRFINEITGPVSIHEFRYNDGWVASHCGIGDIQPANAIIFDWLDRIIIKGEKIMDENQPNNWGLIRKYHHTAEIDKFLQDFHPSAV